MKSIAIIGGGASGTLSLINLLKEKTSEQIHVHAIEKETEYGLGFAYSTDKDFHLLNVPAHNMSAFPDNKSDFTDWLNKNGYSYDVADFVPRKIYGRYLRDCLDKAIKNKSDDVTVTFINKEAVRIYNESSRTFIQFTDDEILETDKVILAFGNFKPSNLRLEDMNYISSKNYYQNPWMNDISERINKSSDVLILGTGLTMTDFVLTLMNNGHEGKIYAISRNGLLTMPSAPTKPYPSFYEEIKGVKAFYELLKSINRHIKIAQNTGMDWRSVIDCLRPHSSAIWIALPPDEKRKFMKRAGHLWAVARHRMPRACYDKLSDLRSKERFEILKGKILEIKQNDSSMSIKYGSKDSREINTLTIDSIINCTGTETDYEKIDSPLIKNLMMEGIIRKDELSLGLDATVDGRIIGKLGMATRNIFTLGPPLKGVLWETTAIPEIRQQAKAIARLVLNDES